MNKIERNINFIFGMVCLPAMLILINKTEQYWTTTILFVLTSILFLIVIIGQFILINEDQTEKKFKIEWFYTPYTSGNGWEERK